MAETIPIIDIGGYLAGRPEALAAAAREVHDALTTVGFFVLTGHDVPMPLIENPRQVVVDEHDNVLAEPAPTGEPTSDTCQPMGSGPADANRVDAMLKSMRAQRLRLAREPRTPPLRNEWERPMDTFGCCYERRRTLRGVSGCELTKATAGPACRSQRSLSARVSLNDGDHARNDRIKTR